MSAIKEDKKTLKKRAMQNRSQNLENEPLVSYATDIEVSGLPDQMGCYPSKEPEVRKCCGSLVGQHNNQDNFDMLNRSQKRMLEPLCSDEQSVATFVPPEPHGNNNHAAPEGDQKGCNQSAEAEKAREEEENSMTPEKTNVLEMAELIYGPAHTGVCEQDDPVSMLSIPDIEPSTHPRLSENAMQMCVDNPGSSSKQKNTRGRPKKRRKQQFALASSPMSSMSYTEAQNTWNTTKLLVISTTDETTIISGVTPRYFPIY